MSGPPVSGMPASGMPASGGPVRSPWPYPPATPAFPPATPAFPPAAPPFQHSAQPVPPWIGVKAGRRPNNRTRLAPWLIGGGVAVVVVLALLVAGAFVAFDRGGADGTGPRETAARRAAAAAERELARSATELAAAPAARYTGTLVGSSGRSMPVEITITAEGSAEATLTVVGEKVEAVALADGLYLKGSAAFWRAQGAAADSVADFGQQWVKADQDLFGSDLTATLAPGALARLLDPREGEQLAIGEPEQVNGAEARAMRVGSLTAYVTTAEPHRIVRLTSGGELGASSDPSDPPTRGTPSVLGDRGRFIEARAPGGTGFALDVAELADPEVEAFYKDLEARVRALKDSLDSRVRFSLAGQITLAPCSTNGCQANVTISNRVQTNSPYVSAQQPVNATVTISMTLDGRPINTCVNAVSMPPNGTATTSCFAAYTIPPARNPTTHFVEAKSRTVARALVQADVDRLVNDLLAEFARNRRSRGPKPSTPPSVTAEPSASGSGQAKPTVTVAPGSDRECEAPAVMSPGGRAHTRSRHFAGGREFRNARLDSEWKRNANLDQLVQASNSVPAKYQPWTDRCERVVDAADFVGTRPPGIGTRQYTVIHLKDGSLWTMHPGPPRRY